MLTLRCLEIYYSVLDLVNRNLLGYTNMHGESRKQFFKISRDYKAFATEFPENLKEKFPMY